MELKEVLSHVAVNEHLPAIRAHRTCLMELVYSYGIIRKKTPDTVTNQPISLNPKCISRASYAELKQNCLAFHRILERLYNKFDELAEFYESTTRGDELVDILFKIYRLAQTYGQDLNKPQCLLIRNDFMYDVKTQSFQQVEFNTVACGLGQQSTHLQRLLCRFYGSFLNQPLDFVPNENAEKQVAALKKAYELYNNRSAVLLFVLLQEERNIFDIADNEKALEQDSIPVLRLRLGDMTPQNFFLEEKTRKLFVFGKEVAVVYMRSLYDPSHFNEHRIDFWAKAEASKAVVLPGIKSFILGIKITQHLFTNDRLLEKYGLGSLKQNPFRKHFCDTKYISTDFNDDKDKLIAFLKEHQDDVMLKSYKESGMGLLLDGREMIEYASSASLDNLRQLLIAHKIESPSYETLSFVENDFRYIENSVSEVSMYSSFVMRRQEDSWKIASEDVWDYLVRTKARGDIKGGIALGASFIDTLVFKD